MIMGVILHVLVAHQSRKVTEESIIMMYINALRVSNTHVNGFDPVTCQVSSIFKELSEAWTCH